MEYTQLEKKVITKGIKSFRKELEEASKPMLAVLKKYGVKHRHPLLEKITLYYPYSERDSFSNCAVSIPGDKDLESIKATILDNFMNEVSELKSRIEDLEFGG
jgi:hypothetical protein